ncbi:GGDEF domain-containing protein [Actinoalloteichus hymeniacidonis]|uniref:Diguanylate cyclase (GGDEF) domain-containing protein n=1 Tax=Actinoalloteichus hymeniacidonis TaxID=340345 RepID=A0AAC9N188_9PSEU|nr:GGDEF domain-containing protein [Actinoalloteichus hymeniacidonis]AOS66150.1 diguanylate cyclase (GGDEF) domain-containing protein [Actinoalloteichus hymeniacidonis]MBB5905747.1 diguanylate cyclase (GGDEF)-like protein [Actinoalloteichus hymeniacidonis]
MSAVGTAARREVGSVWGDIVAELPVGVLLQNMRGDVLAANELAATLLGIPEAELTAGRIRIDQALRDESGAPLPSAGHLIDQLRRHSGALQLPVLRTAPGTEPARLWVGLHTARLSGVDVLLSFLRPVDAEPGRLTGMLDPLTGLPSRALLLDRLQESLIRAGTRGTLVTLVLLDICRLAEVNAAHGFERGDDLLTMLACRLRSGMRADYTVARFGSDEFAVVAEHPRGSGGAIASKVREVAGSAMQLGRIRLHPELRTAWVTSDGSAGSVAMIDRAETILRRRG